MYEISEDNLLSSAELSNKYTENLLTSVKSHTGSLIWNYNAEISVFINHLFFPTRLLQLIKRNQF